MLSAAQELAAWLERNRTGDDSDWQYDPRNDVQRLLEQFGALHEAATQAWALMPSDHQAAEVLADALLAVANASSPAKTQVNLSGLKVDPTGNAAYEAHNQESVPKGDV